MGKDKKSKARGIWTIWIFWTCRKRKDLNIKGWVETNKMGEAEEYDAIMVESKEITVTEDSVVCVSPYNTKTNKWLCGMMEITTMRDVIGRKKIKISKDKNVEDFFSDYYKQKNPGF